MQLMKEGGWGVSCGVTTCAGVLQPMTHTHREKWELPARRMQMDFRRVVWSSEAGIGGHFS
jgi:hypothetical protein